MKIEYLYLMDCPWCEKTRTLLKEAMEELGVQAPVTEILIDDEEKARKHRFVGSPTIRINDRDIQEEVKKARCLPCEEMSESIPSPFVKEECCISGCRIYHYKGKQYPYPPKEMIKEALEKALSG